MRFKIVLKLLFLFLFILYPLYISSSKIYADVFNPFITYHRIDTKMIETGSIKIDGELDFDFVTHKLGNNWTVRPDIKGINKIFNYMPDLNPENKWEILQQERFLFNIGAKPFNWFFAELGFEIMGDYADRYWVPVNEEHRLHNDNQKFDWNNAKIGVIQEWMVLTYYRNYSHHGWKYEDDMFEMFPVEDVPDNLLRYSGHHAPEYFQLKTEGSFGSLDVIYGIEALENYKSGIYVNYKNIFKKNINFFYSDHKIPFGTNNERMRNFQLNTKLNISNSYVQLGMLYRPFRLNKMYQYTHDVGVDNGLDGTKYDVKIGTTNEIDALGCSLKLSIPEIIGINTLSLGYEYRGLVAGNRQKAEASIEKQIMESVNTYLSYYYQKPLIGAMPTIYSGINGNGEGPIAMSARSSESPFWVWWENPVSGFNNRETSAISLVLTYDPTPDTWFYKLDKYLLEAYNLNSQEDASFSCAVKFNYAKYSGTLDRQVHWDYEDNVSWEPIGMNGTAANNKYIGSIYFLTQFIINQTKILYDLEIGKDMASLSYAYSDKDSFLTPITGYFKTSFTVNLTPYLFKAAYLKNYWGPEYWHKQFGLIYDDLCLIHASRDVGDWFNFGAEYVGARKTDFAILNFIKNVDTQTNEVGSFDEIRIFVKIFFSSIFKFGD
jgi:hypothetical protein